MSYRGWPVAVPERTLERIMCEVDTLAAEQGWDEDRKETALLHAVGMAGVARMMLVLGLAVGVVLGMVAGLLVMSL